MVTCPACAATLADFDEDELDQNDEFTCEECGANVRVVGKEPLELESADEEEEDEDEDLDDEDEEDEDADEDDVEEDSEEDRDYR